MIFLLSAFHKKIYIFFAPTFLKFNMNNLFYFIYRYKQKSTIIINYIGFGSLSIHSWFVDPINYRLHIINISNNRNKKFRNKVISRKKIDF